MGDSQILYQISGSDYETLMAASYDDLRHREILPGDYENVTGLTVTLEGETYAITSEGDGDDRTFFYGEEELDMTDLQSALEALTADSFTDASPAGKEEIRLTVTFDLEDHPQTEIVLYRQDGSTCLAEVDGEPVARSLAVSRREGPPAGRRGGPAGPSPPSATLSAVPRSPPWSGSGPTGRPTPSAPPPR